MSLKLKKIAVVLAFFGFTNIWAADCSRDGSIYNTLLCRNKCPLGGSTSSECFYSCKADYDYECKATKLTPKDELALNIKDKLTQGVRRLELLAKRRTERLRGCYTYNAGYAGFTPWENDSKSFKEKGLHLNNRIYNIRGEDFVFLFSTDNPSGFWGANPTVKKVFVLSRCLTVTEQREEQYLWYGDVNVTNKDFRWAEEQFKKEIEDNLKANP